MSRVASSFGILKLRPISSSSIAFHKRTTRIVWCMFLRLMPSLILTSRFDTRMHFPRRTSAIATWISKTYSQEIAFVEWSMTTQARQSSRLIKRVASLTNNSTRVSTGSVNPHLKGPSCLVRPSLCRGRPAAIVMPRQINGRRACPTQSAKWTTPSLRWSQQCLLLASEAFSNGNSSWWRWCWGTNVNRTRQCRSVSVSWVVSSTKTTPPCSSSRRM